MEEQWKQITDYPNYSVSNLGRIRNNKKGTYLKTNNSIDNMEWTTQRENIIHSLRTGLKQYKYVVNEEVIAEIQRLFLDGVSVKEIVLKCKVSKQIVYQKTKALRDIRKNNFIALIFKLREKGIKYKTISDITGLTITNIASYISRYKVEYEELKNNKK